MEGRVRANAVISSEVYLIIILYSNLFMSRNGFVHLCYCILYIVFIAFDDLHIYKSIENKSNNDSHIVAIMDFSAFAIWIGSNENNIEKWEMQSIRKRKLYLNVTHAPPLLLNWLSYRHQSQTDMVLFRSLYLFVFFLRYCLISSFSLSPTSSFLHNLRKHFRKLENCLPCISNCCAKSTCQS